MSRPEAIRLLADVARLLAAHGSTRTMFGRTLELNGVMVASINPSDAVILSPLYRGATMALPARSAVRGDTAEILAALILARLALVTREAA